MLKIQVEKSTRPLKRKGFRRLKEEKKVMQIGLMKN